MTWDLLIIFLGSTLRLAVPLLFAAVGELVSEKSGVVNMSLEGMMLMGAFGGAVGTAWTGSPIAGLLLAIISVLPIAILQAVLTNTLKANQVVTGIGINILVLGLTTLGYREVFGARSREMLNGFDAWVPPVLGNLPVIGPLFHQAWLVYLLFGIIAITVYFMSQTGVGITIRATGENPTSVAKSGLSVAKIRYAAILFTGVMAALGGAFLSLADIHTFTEGMTKGAGYLAIVAVIFGNWQIGRTVCACLLFGGATALQFQLPTLGVVLPNALLIMMPYLLALIAVAGLVGRQTEPRALGQPYKS